MTAIPHAAWLKAPETQALIAALEAARPDGSRFVGGCVRNTLMGRPVDDIDIATQLTPGRVEQVMRPISESLVVTPDASVIQAMGCMAREGWDRLIVMQDGEIVGLVTHSAIVHFLQLRRAA